MFLIPVMSIRAVTLRRLLAGFVVANLIIACTSTNNLSPGQHLDAAREHIAANNPNAAIIEIKNALQKDPGLQEGRWLLGSLYLQLGAGQAAEVELLNARQLGYTGEELTGALLRAYLLQRKFSQVIAETDTGAGTLPAEWMMVRGEALLGLGRLEEAEMLFRQVLAVATDSIEARLGIARIAILSGAYEQAESMLDQTEALAPQEAAVFMLKGELAMRRNDATAAEVSYMQATRLAEFNIAAEFGRIRALLALNRMADVAVALKRVEERSPGNPMTRYFRALIALSEDNQELARTNLLEVLKVLPGHAESQFLMGHITYNQGQMEQSRDYLRAFLGQNSEHAEALQLLATVQIRLNQIDQAIANINKAMEKKGEDPTLLALLASANIAAGRVNAGVELLEDAIELDPENPTIATQLATAYLNLGSIDRAVSVLEKTISLSPMFVSARELLVTIHIRNSNFDAAIQTGEGLVSLQPDSASGSNLLGTAYMGVGKMELARTQFEGSIALDPAYIPALYNLARLEVTADNLEAAEVNYRRILAIDPNHVQTLLELARLESRKGEVDNMIGFIQQARIADPNTIRPRLILGRYYASTGDSAKLLEIATESAKVAPGNPDIQLLLGQALRLNGRPDEALLTLNTLNEKLAGTPAIMYELAQIHLQLGNNDAARGHLSEVLRLIPNHPAALGTSIELAIRENDQELARKYASELQSQQPDSPQAFSLMGDTYVSERKYQEAIAAYEQAYNATRSFVLTAKLSQTYELSGDREKAIRLMELWRDENPADSRADLVLAGIYMRAENNAAAVEHYEKVLTRQPDNSVALNNLSWLYVDIDLTRAHELAEKANRIKPNDAGVMDTLGWILARQGKNEQAIPLLRRALSLSPESGDIRYHLAYALAAAGDRDLAQDELARALGSGDDFMEKQAAIELSTRLQ